MNSSLPHRCPESGTAHQWPIEMAGRNRWRMKWLAAGLCLFLGAGPAQAGTWRLHLGGWSWHSSPPSHPDWTPALSAAARNWAEGSATPFVPNGSRFTFAPAPTQWNESHDTIGLSYETAGRWRLGVAQFTDSFGYDATALAAGKRWHLAGQSQGWTLGASLGVAAQYRQMDWITELQPGTGIWVPDGQGDFSWVTAQGVLKRKIEWSLAPLPSLSLGYKRVELELGGLPSRVTGNGTVLLAMLSVRLR